ncbi:hypothetical protein J2T38_002303 [Neisseria perflava]|uniref:zonular occludens toxin domain-containing protein n=1 Tax=Neisseria perflava TaxID=33053 RepID=UPI00209DC25D|nr:zonular occludens toxin domain-containing protein [Neisseria perflava]MCP1773449.1 hypothetical protein [Neisseria perflava]
MIYLITGTPGTGKTSKVVSMILDNYDGIFTYETEDGTKLNRPLYFCHIDGLDVQKFKAHELTEEQIQAAPLKDIVPTGSVLIVDEADYCYPVRSASREVPPYIKRLKELRHEGFTLIVMTQHPSMLDSYLRNLVGKHIHLERKQLGTKQYEFLRCETNLSATTLAQGVGTFYKPDKRAFKYYKSASMHVKFKKKLHWSFFALPCILAFVAYMGFSFKDKVSGKTPESQAVEAAADVSSASAGSAASAPQTAASVPSEFSEAYYEPRVADKPETAPIYDSVRKVSSMEYPVACVDSSISKGCTCYSDQGTVVKVSRNYCKMRFQDGIYNPYKEPERSSGSSKRQSAQNTSDSSEVLVMGGESQQNLMYDNRVSVDSHGTPTN